MQLTDVLIFLVAGLVALGALSLVKANNRGGVPDVRAKAMLTGAEIGFLKILRAAAAPLEVAPQVAMGALLQPVAGLDKRAWRSVRNRFDRKIVDFVLIDDAGRARLIVELDDKTHRAAKDSARDAMTAKAGYITLRLSGSEARDVASVRRRIGDVLGLTPVAIDTTKASPAVPLRIAK